MRAKVVFMPKTNLGIWSVRLILIFFVSLAVFFLLITLGQRGGETFFSNPLLVTPLLVAGIAGAASSFTGSVSIFVQKERSVLVFVTSVVGLFVVYFAFGEVLSPH